MEPQPELSLVMAVDDIVVRRAALEGLRPGFVALADSAVRDPARLALVEDDWLAAALSCLGRADAERAVAVDGRSAAGVALAEVHGAVAAGLRRDLAGRPAGSVTPLELRQWVLEGLVDPDEAHRYARRTGDPQLLVSVLVGVLAAGPTDPGVLDRARDVFVELFWGHCGGSCGGEVGWGQLSELVPGGWWGHGGPLNAHAVSLMWEGPLSARAVAAVLDEAPLDAAAARWVLARATAVGAGRRSFLFDDQLVLVDRALRTVDAPVPVFTMRPEDLLGALELVGPGALRERCVDQLLSGAWGAVQDERAVPAVVALGPTPEQVAAALGPWMLADWAACVEESEWPAVLALLDAEAADNAAGDPVWDGRTAARDRFVAVAVEVVPGMLAVLAGWGDRDVAGAVLDRVAGALGDDALAWQALWNMAADWPGTVASALECVAACRGPAGR